MIKSKIEFGLIAETKNRLFISWKGIKQVGIKFQRERGNWLGDLMVYTNANSQQSYKETTHSLSNHNRSSYRTQKLSLSLQTIRQNENYFSVILQNTSN